MRYLLVLMVATLVAPQASHACSCALESEEESAAVTKAFAEADTVFVGRIENVEMLPKDQSGIEVQRTRFYQPDRAKTRAPD
jgi:hypothetical protein